MPSAIEVRSVPPRPALLVHARCPLEAIGATLGPIFGEVASWAGAHGVALAGPAVARYVNMDAGQCELDAGFIVAGAPAGAASDARVHPTELGGGQAAVATHVGPYQSLHETYRAIQQWMGEHGYVPAGPMWEEYFSPPGTPPDKIRTDIYWPVAKKA